jgi:hypothetical protein
MLHQTLALFTEDAAATLAGATADGDELAFEVVETGRGSRGPRVPLYCYRPLTGEFIGERAALLCSLSSYAPAARALQGLVGTEAYLRRRDLAIVADDPRERADQVLHAFLARVFEDRSAFEFEPDRFERAYADLESTLYSGECMSLVVAPVLGVMLAQDTPEVDLADGLSLVRGELVTGAPNEAVWGDAPDPDPDQPQVLAVLRAVQDRSARAPVADARRRFRRLLTTLRLYERGAYALGPMAWSRVDDGPWRSLPLGQGGRPRRVTLLSSRHAADLRSIYGQVTRRMPAPAFREGRSGRPTEMPGTDSSGLGELTWALARFEMGCERPSPLEALTDYLIALRALLEPEGPASGRLGQRLAVICAVGEDRLALAERTAQAVSLERSVIAGLGPARDGSEETVEELADHLRAILRDVVCGHLDVDVRGVADDLLTRAAVGVG